mmetsp:Transcript_63854/g.144094  ORF Transcript_63854/g.144094 Transcript_63854/m.144094 type:complete len:256 (-) Transcript_63854:194-961(-)
MAVFCVTSVPGARCASCRVASKAVKKVRAMSRAKTPVVMTSHMSSKLSGGPSFLYASWKGSTMASIRTSTMTLRSHANLPMNCGLRTPLIDQAEEDVRLSFLAALGTCTLLSSEPVERTSSMTDCTLMDAESSKELARKDVPREELMHDPSRFPPRRQCPQSSPSEIIGELGASATLLTAPSSSHMVLRIGSSSLTISAMGLAAAHLRSGPGSRDLFCGMTSPFPRALSSKARTAARRLLTVSSAASLRSPGGSG